MARDKEKTSELFDIYGSLLSEKQQEYVRLFYNDDLSLTEIGSLFDISKQSVSDTLNAACSKMDEYEAALHIIENQKFNEDIIQSSLEIITGIQSNKALNGDILSQLNHVCSNLEMLK